MTKAACTVLNRGSLGLELVVIKKEKLDLFNFNDNKWRSGPPTNIVRIEAIFYYYYYYLLFLEKEVQPPTFPVVFNVTNQSILVVQVLAGKHSIGKHLFLRLMTHNFAHSKHQQ